MIAHETGVTNTVDPLGGSYFVEKLTDEMEAAAYAYFARIDELGGMVAAIKTSFPQREIADAAFEYQREVETEAADHRRRQRVPRSTTTSGRDPPARSRRRAPPARALARTRRRATRRPVERALDELRSARPATDANLMPALIAAARARASEGEMVAAMQEVFGTYTEHPQF